jgi:hypothetical protein
MSKAQRIGDRHGEDVEDVGTAQDGAPEEDTDTEEDDGSEQEPAKGTKEAKYRKQRNEARSTLRNVRTELENLKASQAESAAVIEELCQSRTELAFVKAAAHAGVTDTEAAWKLCDRELLTWEEQDGEDRLSGVEDALEKVLDRYPYISRSEDTSRTDDHDKERVRPPMNTSGKPTNGPKKGPQELDLAYLERKFPSLARRGSNRPMLYR